MPIGIWGRREEVMQMFHDDKKTRVAGKIVEGHGYISGSKIKNKKIQCERLAILAAVGVLKR